MDTITINSGKANEKEGKNKNKGEGKLSETAQAALASTVAGIGVGVAGTIMADKFSQTNEDKEEDPVVDPQQDEQYEEPDVDPIPVDVNPDEVMLEEPDRAPTPQAGLAAAAEAEPSAEPDYHTFANNDILDEDPVPEPLPDDVLIAEVDETDTEHDYEELTEIIDEGTEEEVIDIPGEPNPEEDFYADVDPSTDIDIQTDLMA